MVFGLGALMWAAFALYNLIFHPIKTTVWIYSIVAQYIPLVLLLALFSGGIIAIVMRLRYNRKSNPHVKPKEYYTAKLERILKACAGIIGLAFILLALFVLVYENAPVIGGFIISTWTKLTNALNTTIVCTIIILFVMVNLYNSLRREHHELYQEFCKRLDDIEKRLDSRR